MKNLSIKAKITLWFSAALIIVMALTYFVILSAGRQVIQKTIKDNLVETVENNVDEIEYYSVIQDWDLYNSSDYYLQYEDGYLEIDDDFLDEVNDIYTSLCKSDGTLVYGESPIVRETNNLEFLNSEIQTVTSDGVVYYVFDRELTSKGLEGLWLRGVVSEAQGETELSAISRASLIVLPPIVLLAIVGGYLIARRMLKPIKKISDAAAQIERGNDLKKRIEIGKGKDELHRLAERFNSMFERLDESFQAEQQFVSDVSHELRTPVSVIMAQCELTLEEERSVSEYKSALRVINRQGNKMSRLIGSMLDFTRLELKTERYECEELDLSELVESICLDMALIRENGITLTCETEKEVLFFGNRELLTRLLANLISNAYRYGKPDGHIYVSLKTEKEEILLSVKDDGIGIAEEEQKSIFRRFYQVDSSHSGAGNGLGLSMVKEIARFHSGEILLESKLGEGSTFTLKLRKNKK